MPEKLIPLNRINIDIEDFEKNDLSSKCGFTFDDTQTGTFKTSTGDEYTYQLTQQLFINRVTST